MALGQIPKYVISCKIITMVILWSLTVTACVPEMSAEPIWGTHESQLLNYLLNLFFKLPRREEESELLHLIQFPQSHLYLCCPTFVTPCGDQGPNWRLCLKGAPQAVPLGLATIGLVCQYLSIWFTCTKGELVLSSGNFPVHKALQDLPGTAGQEAELVLWETDFLLRRKWKLSGISLCSLKLWVTIFPSQREEGWQRKI